MIELAESEDAERARAKSHPLRTRTPPSSRLPQEVYDMRRPSWFLPLCLVVPTNDIAVLYCDSEAKAVHATLAVFPGLLCLGLE